MRSSSETDDQAEFIKDLLAALKEAEERIESLETVLSEQTPCGNENETGPNYSRLLAACRSSIDVIQHLNQLFCERPSHGSCKASEEDIQNRAEGMLNRWEKIESATTEKEMRATENAKKWKHFMKELEDIEKWLLDSLDSQTTQSRTDADVEKFILILQKHKALISQISEKKETIVSLNLTGKKYISSAKVNFSDIEGKLKDINSHWDKLCCVAFEWQNRLQTEFLQSSEFCKTLSEMELWLEDSKEKALKQQLENCTQRVKTLLDIFSHLFQDKGDFSVSNKGVLEVQSRLHTILSLSQCLLLECSEILTSLSELLTSRMASQENARLFQQLTEDVEESPNRISRCCNFLLRVARASFPIQAVLLLLLGAAILLPKEEEEISCRLSNNFASSVNPMLHYPDGPPPV
ncbi:nesprin-1 [Caerostris extrusa]|uniref:Nesprin-1 n=1 Tax=Caerostris extrusa TaxID=172846 RepID=A0AAV4XZ25_CAEEX|nr:nesprin-1 [Caerostris extrusa]